MKLSAAIRKGIEMRPVKCTGDFLRGRDRACALGAAYVAIKGAQAAEDGELIDALLQFVWPELQMKTSKVIGRPPYYGATLQEAIVELNDTRGYGRAEIADWLEENGL